MINRMAAIITFTLLAFVGLQRSATAALQVTNETEFKLYMQKIADGTITSGKCTDPNPSYDKYCYVEITKSFELTEPVSIPARVRLVGIPIDGQLPEITAFIDVAKYKPDAPACMLSFNGDQGVLENVKIIAKNYFKEQSPPQVNTICLKSDYSFLNNVEIATPLELNKFTLVTQANGILVTGNHNMVRGNRIILKFGNGIALQGKDNSVTATKVVTEGYGMVFRSKDQSVVNNNTVTGKVAFIFSSGAQIPVGQAANIVLLNTYTDTDHTDATMNPEGYIRQYEKYLPLPQCGTCKGIPGDEKVLYADDGTCKPIPASGACIELKGAFAPMQLTVAQQAPDSELQINQNAKQPTILPATTPTPGSELEARNVKLGQPAFSEAGGTGGCSLIR